MGLCDFWAFDLETTSAVVTDPDFRIIGLGLANADICFYIHVAGLDADATVWLKEWILSVRLTAFNVLFDGAAIQRWTGSWPRIESCSYGLFKSLTNEGYPGQRWGLKQAMIDVLGWPSKNDFVLRRWLIENGYVKGRPPSELLEKLQKRVVTEP